MAFVVDPRVRDRFAAEVLRMMKDLQKKHRRAIPFARRPEVFAFRLNRTGLASRWATARENRLLSLPVGRLARPKTPAGRRRANGRDEKRQEENRRLLRAGEIGRRGNRLRGSISDIRPGDIIIPPPPESGRGRLLRRRGEEAIREGLAAVVTLSGGLGSRWSEGRETIKALDPFLMVDGRHRSFLEIHIAKSELTARRAGFPLQHAFTVSGLNRSALAAEMRRRNNFSFSGRFYLSPSPDLLRRLVPTVSDLAAAGDRKLASFIPWAKSRGEGSDFVASDPLASRHPPGHWFEIPALLRNGCLGRMLADNPRLSVLFVHNLDTLGASLDPALLALHLESQAALGFEAIPRLWSDRGGFLARHGGRARIVESLALPREEDADRLSWYNSLSSWISIDPLLSYLGLSRADVRRAGSQEGRRIVDQALQKIEKRLKTYAAIKFAEEDAGDGRRRKVPVVQCEKLWGDMTALPDLPVAFLAAERQRGQQLKDPALLDHWLRDGSQEHLLKLCRFQQRRLF
jgi:hypothetical protein